MGFWLDAEPTCRARMVRRGLRARTVRNESGARSTPARHDARFPAILESDSQRRNRYGQGRHEHRSPVCRTCNKPRDSRSRLRHVARGIRPYTTADTRRHGPKRTAGEESRDIPLDPLAKSVCGPDEPDPGRPAEAQAQQNCGWIGGLRDWRDDERNRCGAAQYGVGGATPRAQSLQPRASERKPMSSDDKPQGTFDNRLRRFVYRQMIRKGRCPTAAEMTKGIESSLAKVRAALQRLSESHAFMLQENGELWRVAPFSAI